MSYKKITFVLIAVIISLIASSWIWIRDYYTDINGKIDSSILSDYAAFTTLILTFWGLVLNIILVYLAYEAFKNFDVKKQFHNKQLDIVSELATAISSTLITNTLYANGTGIFKIRFFEVAMFDYTLYDSIYLRTRNVGIIFLFLKYRRHPILPKSISKHLDKLYRLVQRGIFIPVKDLPNEYLELTGNIPTEEYVQEGAYVIYENPSDFSIDSLALRQSITSWFKQYGADDLNV